MRFAAIAAFATLLIVTPVLVMSAFTTRAIDAQLIERENVERERATGIAARLIEEKLTSAGDSLRLLSRRVLLREALARRDAAGLARHVHDLHSVSDLYASAAAFAPDGTMLAREPAGGEGQSYAFRDYFRGAVASTVPFVSEVYRSAVPPSSPLVAIAYAVRDGDRLLGVLQLTLAPADVLRPLASISDFPGRTVVITDDAGRVIASTDAARAPLSDAGLDRGRLAEIPYSSRGTLDGRDSFVSAAALRSADWGIYVIDEATFVLALQREIRQQRINATGATGVVALVLGILLALLYEKVARQRDRLRLTEQELTDANVGLQAAGRHKSEFLANMSHELRTPLNAILGFSALLRERDAVPADKSDRYLANISDAGEHLLALINEVLDISTIEAGRLSLRPDRTTASTLITPVIDGMGSVATAAGVDLSVDVRGNELIRVDSQRIRQVLLNLLSNAVKFTPRGGSVTLRVGVDGADLVAEVADTGIGIPDDRQARVFGLFERVNEDRSAASGTGLGLALTKRIVELHGGTLTFVSEVGSGTKFWVRLPGVVVEQVAPERLLIVEDEERDAQLIRALAGDVGLVCETVTTVAGALEALQRDAPLGVVLDLRLPDGRGEQVLAAVRGRSTTRSLPVAIVSVEDDAPTARALGASAMLTKPIDVRVLSDWLARLRDPVAARAVS